jgi:Leucine-rich repeat (LRR) protein
VWQQIFRHHLNIKYKPTELDLFRAVHSVIDHCQDDKLRNKISTLITNKRFTQQITKWYDSLTSEKTLFNSYLPYEPSKREIEQVFKLTKINCANNIAVLDLKPLERLLELREINATNTNISNLSTLKNLLKLEVIQLNYTKIDSLDDLIGLPRLMKIDCYSTDMHTKEIKKFEAARPHCEVLDSTFLSAMTTKK